VAREVDADLPLLQRELLDSHVVSWDDPAVDWRRFDAVIIRSTWDYHERRDDFLRWANHVDDVSTLWNPIDVIEWNTDKRYLADLELRGIPIVPTMFCADEAGLSDLDLDGDIIVKPTVGAGSNGVVHVRCDAEMAAHHARSLLAADLTVMVQPYLADVDVMGETGLVYFGGEFSHAFNKAVILASPVDVGGDLMAAETSAPHTASPAQRALGDRVVDALPETAYARIDLLPTPNGPLLLEVELTEPSLFLHHDAEAPARAAAVFRSLTA